jgi:flagellin
MIQTAEGALSETHSILQRMRELAVQAASDTNTDDDRTEIQQEIDQLTEEITRISTDTEFNTQKLLDGSMQVVTSNNEDVMYASASNAVASGTYSVAITETKSTSNATGGTWTTNSASSTMKAGVYTLTATDADSYTVTDANGNPIDIGTSTDEFDSAAVTLAGATAGDTTTLTIALSGKVTTQAGIKNIVLGADATTETAANLTVKQDKSATFQIGANSGQNTTLSISSMSANALGVDDIKLTSQSLADSAITIIDKAITTVSSQRSALGAAQNRLEHTINNLSTSSENLSAAESQIRDVDMAEEMTEYTKNNILSQAAQAMLAQANQQPQNVLQLLQ